MLERLSLRLRIFLFFAALAAGILAALVGGLWLGYARLDAADPFAAFLIAGLAAGFVSLGLVAWVWQFFDEHVARAIQSLAGGLRARAHAEVDGEMDAAVARYLGDLAPAARAVAGTLAETKNALAEAVERETTRLALENARLQALLADVPAGVLLCTAEHQIVFYNGPAQELFSGGLKPGLDRSILDFLRPGALANAYERLTRSDDPDAASDLLCASVHAREVYAGRMRLVQLAGRHGEAKGYVLTLRDVTVDLALHAAREALLAEIFDRVRRPAANLQTVLAAGIASGPEGQAALLAEVGGLAAAITDLGERYDATRGQWWPMAETRASDLVEGVVARCARVGIVLTADQDRLLLRCDAAQVVALLSDLVERIAREHGGTALSLRIAAEDDAAGGGALVTLGWAGPVLHVATLERWLEAPLDVGLAGVTGRSALAAHGTDAWPEPGHTGRAVLRVPLREARPVAAAPRAPRTAVYDFDLMTRPPTGELAQTRLRDLTCVVFDTETTGLLPSSGDEIVQIAALRLLGGRRIPGESFEELVDPGRPIPAAATAVHHITEEMVRGRPGIAEVGRRFHAFARGAVLVAHNAPFDLEFLRRHEEGIGARFDNPVLDTVLLSAVVFGQSEAHTLDALTERLGIVIPPEARHTAMGDTIATAAALEKMIPLLEAQGCVTFGETVAAVRKHGRLLKDLNESPAVPA